MDDEIRMTVRLPTDAAEFLSVEAKKNFTSRNAQVVRAIRSAMKVKGPAAVAPAPSHGSSNPNLEKAYEQATE